MPWRQPGEVYYGLLPYDAIFKDPKQGQLHRVPPLKAPSSLRMVRWGVKVKSWYQQNWDGQEFDIIWHDLTISTVNYCVRCVSILERRWPTMSCGISLSVKALKALKAQPQETGAIYELVATVTAPSLGQHVGDAAFNLPTRPRRYLYNYLYIL